MQTIRKRQEISTGCFLNTDRRSWLRKRILKEELRKGFDCKKNYNKSSKSTRSSSLCSQNSPKEAVNFKNVGAESVFVRSLKNELEENPLKKKEMNYSFLDQKSLWNSSHKAASEQLYSIFKTEIQNQIESSETQCSFNDLEPEQIALRRQIVSSLYTGSKALKLSLHTFFLSVFLLDKCFSNNKLDNFPAIELSAACLLTAVKFEESRASKISSVNEKLHQNICRKDLVAAEAKLLHAVEFKIFHTSPLQVMEVIHRLHPFEEKILIATEILIQLSVFDYRVSFFCSNVVLASACSLAERILSVKNFPEGYFCQLLSASTASVKACKYIILQQLVRSQDMLFFEWQKTIEGDQQAAVYFSLLSSLSNF